MKKKYSSVIFLVVVLCLSVSSCETDTESKVYLDLIGAYSCQENSAYSGYKKFLVEIDQVKFQENLYIISNFNNQSSIEFLYATLKNDTLIIDNQVISGVFINGKGIINQDFNRINWFYITDDGNIELEYFATFSR